MTPSALLQCLLQMREWFPRHIVQEWSNEEHQRSARDLDRRLLAALDPEGGWMAGEDEIP